MMRTVVVLGAGLLLLADSSPGPFFVPSQTPFLSSETGRFAKESGPQVAYGGYLTRPWRGSSLEVPQIFGLQSPAPGVGACTLLSSIQQVNQKLNQ